jgi:hypothetical protein
MHLIGIAFGCCTVPEPRFVSVPMSVPTLRLGRRNARFDATTNLPSIFFRGCRVDLQHERAGVWRLDNQYVKAGLQQQREDGRAARQPIQARDDERGVLSQRPGDRANELRLLLW